MGFLIVYKKLISKENYNALRIRCIMLILEEINNFCTLFKSPVFLTYQSGYVIV